MRIWTDRYNGRHYGLVAQGKGSWDVGQMETVDTDEIIGTDADETVGQTGVWAKFVAWLTATPLIRGKKTTGYACGGWVVPPVRA